MNGKIKHHSTRRRANRTVLVSAIISAVITGILHIAVNTLLFIDDVSHTILGVFQLLTIIGAFIWFGFALRTGSVLAIFTIIGMIMFTLMMGNSLPLTVPFAITDTLEADGYTYYLVESIKSRQGVATDSFFVRELYRCEGDSRRMWDCEWLWYEQTLIMTSEDCARYDTYFTVSDKVLRVEAKMSCEWGTPPDEDSYRHRVLHEINLTEGQE